MTVNPASTKVTREVENKMSFQRVTSTERPANGFKVTRVPVKGLQD